MFLLMGCIWSTSAFWDSQAWENRSAVGDPQVSDPARIGVMTLVLATTGGGLALAVFGLGLQSDQPKAAWAAMTTLGFLLGCLAFSGVALWTGSAGPSVRIVHTCLLLVTLVLIAFVAAALKQVIDHPPPPGQGVVPYDFDPHQPDRH